MWVICGLGNPGKEYEKTRHNFGFLVLEVLAKKKGLKFEFEPQLEAEIATLKNRAILVKPLTFMNLSGRAVSKVLKKYHITPQSLLVVHDDLDLPLGRIRLIPKGGAGGHRGVLSIMEALGNGDFPRMKLGVGKPKDQDVKEYVLSPFSETEMSVVERVVERAIQGLEEILYVGLQKAMNKVNSERD